VAKCKLRRKSNEDQDEFTSRVKLAYASDPARYFYRESLQFSRSDIDAFEYEMRQTHEEFRQLTRDGVWDDPLFRHTIADDILRKAKHDDPRSWPPNDATCDEYFRACEFLQLCTKGLDRSTALQYEWQEDLHTELDNSTFGGDDD
jgi:hypothetical protein